MTSKQRRLERRMKERISDPAKYYFVVKTFNKDGECFVVIMHCGWPQLIDFIKVNPLAQNIGNYDNLISAEFVARQTGFYYE